MIRLDTEVTAAPTNDSNDTPKLTVESIDNHIYFYSEVNSDRCLALIKLIKQIDVNLRNERLSRSIPDSFEKTPIWFHVQSCGGDLMAAFAVADQIKKIHTPVYSMIEGVCASAGTILSCCCKKRYITQSSFMLIHQLSSFQWGRYEEFKDHINLLDMCMKQITNFYKNNTKMNLTKIQALLKRDSWFDAKQSLALGLVDEII